MDSELLEFDLDETSTIKREHKTLTDIFNEVYPFYLSIGMTESQFWDEDVTKVKFYTKANEYKQKQRNHDSWLQGLYIYRAYATVLSKAFDKNSKMEYFEEPIPITKEDIEKMEEKKRLEEEEKVLRWFNSLGK